MVDNPTVEVDGPRHLKREVKDQLRDQLLRGEGYLVLHLPAELCLKKPGEAVDRIKQSLVELSVQLKLLWTGVRTAIL